MARWIVILDHLKPKFGMAFHGAERAVRRIAYPYASFERHFTLWARPTFAKLL